MTLNQILSYVLSCLGGAVAFFAVYILNRINDSQNKLADRLDKLDDKVDAQNTRIVKLEVKSELLEGGHKGVLSPAQGQ